MRPTALIRLLVALLLLAAAIGTAPLTIPARAQRTAPPADEITVEPSPVEMLSEMAGAAPMAKIAPALRTAAAENSNSTQLVVVESAEPIDLGAFAERVHTFTWPAGEHVAILDARSADLVRIASLPGVARISSGELDPTRRPLDPNVLESLGIRAGLASPPDSNPGSPPAIAEGGRDDPGDSVPTSDDGRGNAPSGWFDIRDGHSAAEAWGMGFRGTGVKVAMLDTGVDFAQQDLQDTWAVLPDGHPYAGWPQVYDPTAAYQFVIDRVVAPGSGLLRTGQGGLIELYQESEVTETEREGQTVTSACFRPLNARFGLLDAECDYIVPASKGARVRFGHHPDYFLTAIRRGEFVGVLLVDANESGAYDTIYVDLDSDHDFTDEKPVTKSSPLSWRDIDDPPDGIADLSGGLLYFLADGKLPIPGAYLWGVEDEIPEAGTLVGMFVDLGLHGTMCSSSIVSQGRLGEHRGRVSLRDLPGGVPAAVNPGLAPGAKLVAIGDVLSTNIVTQSAWRYAIFGHDPDRQDDDVQITSNSYGSSELDHEGWDPDSRFIDHYVRSFSPSTTFLVATGNGAPGYGTITPPSPVTGLGIGSSTQFGSAVGLSITETRQITFGDIVAFSNRGPGADGRNGPDITANGASGWGAAPLNILSANPGAVATSTGRGEEANIPWGGTSRSSPAAAGAMALTYEAFRTKHGRWPTWQEARSVLMAGARFAGYDTFTMGAGVLDAADAVRIASGDHGVFAIPSRWTAGDYRGKRYPGFAKLATPGSTHTVSFTLRNPSDGPIDVTLRGQTLRRLGAHESVLNTNLNSESEYKSPGAYGDLRAIPDYLIPIERGGIPEGTDLMIVRAALPLTQADIDRDDAVLLENSYSVRIIQHTDWDGDGQLWSDANSNGTVNFQQNGNGDIDWSTAEMDRYEFEALNEHTAETNNWEVGVHHPLERWRDGLHIGVWHSEMDCEDENDPETCTGRTPLMPETTMTFRIEFFAYEDWAWLTVSDPVVKVPANDELAFSATLRVPADAAPGAYQGAIFADYDRAGDDPPFAAGGGYELPVQRVVIPVNANVSARYAWQGTIALGGKDARDGDSPYDNGAVRGGTDRSWRPETGDWRFFFVDASDPAPGTRWLVRTRWDDAIAESSDIDTSIWGRARDRYSDPSDPENSDDDWSDLAWYGPHTLEKIGASQSAYVDSGTWRFNTTSGANEDWIAAPAAEGLTELMLHHVLFSGSQFELPFETTVGSVRVRPALLHLYSDGCTTMYLESQIDLDGFEFAAIGLSDVTEVHGQSLGAGELYTHTLTVEGSAARFVVALRGEPGSDLDLVVYYDLDRDGEADEELARSESPTANERVELSGIRPPGDYLIVVEPFDVPASGTTFDLTIDVVSGNDMRAQGVPANVEAGREYSVEVCTNGVEGEDGPLNGVVVFGPEGGPAVVSAPVTWMLERPVHTVFLPRLHLEGER